MLNHNETISKYIDIFRHSSSCGGSRNDVPTAEATPRVLL